MLFGHRKVIHGYFQSQVEVGFGQGQIMGGQT